MSAPRSPKRTEAVEAEKENAAGVFGDKSAFNEFVAQRGLRFVVNQESATPIWFAIVSAFYEPEGPPGGDGGGSGEGGGSGDGGGSGPIAPNTFGTLLGKFELTNGTIKEPFPKKACPRT